MLPALSMACSGTGTAPVASVDWSAHMAFRLLGSKIATRAPLGNCMATMACDHSCTRCSVCAQVRLAQVWVDASNAR